MAKPDRVAPAFAALVPSVPAGDPIPMESTLRTYPVRPRSVREYARQALSEPSVEAPA